MAKKQEMGLRLRTEALTPASDAHDRPFVRYQDLKDEIWDVWCGKKISTAAFTFGEHFKRVTEILEDVGAMDLAETLKAHDDILSRTLLAELQLEMPPAPGGVSP